MKSSDAACLTGVDDMYSWGLLQFMWSWEGRSTVGRQSRVVLGTVSRRWKFSRRSFYRGLCGHAEAVIACCRQPSPPDGTPAAPQDPRVLLPPAACWCPELHPTSQTPASGSTLCALCSAPVQKKKRKKERREHIIKHIEQSIENVKM